jgi:hypothetical protein
MVNPSTNGPVNIVYSDVPRDEPGSWANMGTAISNIRPTVK